MTDPRAAFYLPDELRRIRAVAFVDGFVAGAGVVVAAWILFAYFFA